MKHFDWFLKSMGRLFQKEMGNKMEKLQFRGQMYYYFDVSWMRACPAVFFPLFIIYLHLPYPLSASYHRGFSITIYGIICQDFWTTDFVIRITLWKRLTKLHQKCLLIGHTEYYFIYWTNQRGHEKLVSCECLWCNTLKLIIIGLTNWHFGILTLTP